MVAETLFQERENVKFNSTVIRVLRFLVVIHFRIVKFWSKNFKTDVSFRYRIIIINRSLFMRHLECFCRPTKPQIICYYEPLAHLEAWRLWRGITIHNFAARFARCAFGTPKYNGVDTSIDIFLVASLEYHFI